MDDNLQKMLSIRYASEKDLKGIVKIFNQAIHTRMSTGYLNEITVEQRKEWFSEHGQEKYPILVAEKNNKIVGWISIDPYRKGRKAFKKTVEVSYFVHNTYRRKGIGDQLLQVMMHTAKKLGYITIFAIVLDKNIGSRKLLEKNNFEQWAFLPDVAEIDGNTLSHVYYGKKL
ncbi:MAG: GNAT family N-acetyltransferase [Euryarchaeota archaeon]|jgi:phosphinothricin acetyltransferase|nr:GNAT family N-acetyltransferase [Euryarchaeota archaeon]